MINNILTYSDFREIAEHCKHCLGGLGIRDFIKDIFREFGKSNTNLALSMMEYLEQNYQPIEGIEGLIDHEYDILNFRDEVPEIENASIEYLYMLLNDIAEKRTIEVKSRDVEKMYIKAKYDINKLNRILTNLKSQNFCEFTDVSKVNWIFLEKEQGPDDEKIRWIEIAPRSKNVQYITIFYLIELLCGINLTKYQSGNQHFNVIIDRFLYSDNGDFSIKNLHERYKVYNTLRNNGETLKKESYIRLKKAVDSA